MAKVDPRITQFEAEAQQVLAAVQRANAEAKTLQGALAEDVAAESRLRASLESRGATGGVVGTERAAATEQTASRRLVTDSEQRTAALSDEEAVLQKLNVARAEGVSVLEAEAALYRRMGTFGGAGYGAKYGAQMVAQQGEYAGGRAAFNQFGFAGGYMGGPPRIPPGGRVPPEGGFPALPAPAGPVSKVGSSLDMEMEGYYKARAAAERYRASVDSLIQSQNGASLAMRRHGALTTEFITAAQRGQVTLRELGWQVGQTTAKFGGWLVAGTALYAAFGALNKVYHGALDTASGVQQMSRVINNLDVGKATKEVRELSEHFNLPVGEVTEAAFDMGKAFHNQADAMLATKAALYAVKVGELDTGTATRYLISIIQGFHLSAQDMSGLFDELLTAQKRYAIDLPSLMAGVAKAAGSFRAAGGDVHTLIALITTLQHVSGQTGTTLGTAIQRSPHFIALAENQAKLRTFGINPSASIETVYKEAIDAAQHLSGGKQRELAEALFGPQYAARAGIFLLQNKQLFERVLRQTAPANAKGAAEEQLRITLGKANEQVSELGTKLEQLGAALAQSHAFDGIFLLLGLLKGTLKLTTDMVEAFNELPGPLRQTLSYMLQLSILMRSLGRLKIGESIAGGPVNEATGARGLAAGLFTSPRTAARDFQAGLYAKREAFEQAEADVEKRRLEAARRSDMYHRQFLAEQEKLPTLIQQSNAGTEASAEALQSQKIKVAELEVLWKEQGALLTRLGAEQAYNAAVLEETNAALATTKGRFGRLNTEAALAEKQRVEATYPGVVGAPVTGAGKAAQAAEKAAEESATVAKAGRAESMLQRAEAGFSRATTSFTAMKVGMVGLGQRMSMMFGTVLNVAIALGIVATAVELLKSGIDSLESGAAEDIRKLEEFPDSAQGLHRLAHRHAHGHGSLRNSLLDFIHGSGAAHGPLEELFGFGSEQGQGGKEQEVEERVIREARDIAKVQDFRRGRGEPVPYRQAGDIEKQIVSLSRRGLSRKALEKQLDRLDTELSQSAEASGHGAGTEHQQLEKLHKAETALREARAGADPVNKFRQALLTIPIKQREKWLSDFETLIQGPGGTYSEDALKRATTILQVETNRLGGSHSPEDLVKLHEQREAFYNAIGQAVETEISNAQLLARTPEARRHLYQQALGHLHEGLLGDARQEIERQQQKLQAAQEKLQQQETHTAHLRQVVEGPRIGPYVTGMPGAASKKQLEQAERQIKAEADGIKALQHQLDEARREYRLRSLKIRQQIFQATSQVRDARASYESSLTADPVQQYRIELQRINSELPQAIKLYGHQSQEVYQLLEAREQALANMVKNELALLRANLKYRAAGIPQYNTVAQARASLSELQQTLSFESSHPGQFSPVEVRELETEIRSAEVALTESLRERAEALAHARFGKAIARAEAAGHPLHAIAAEIQQAQYDLHHAKTPAEREEAESSLINLRAKRRDEAAQVRLSNIEYERDINRITVQQEIAALEQMLHDFKLSKDMRRQIREQIHGLKNELSSEGSGFALDVGSITLPTVYDIRRAIQGGIQNHPGIQVNNAPHITINNYSNDEHVVGKALGRALNGPTNSALRSAGIGG